MDENAALRSLPRVAPSGVAGHGGVRLTAALLGCALAGCTGRVEDRPVRPGGGPTLPVVCQGDGGDPVAAPLARLSRVEYERSLRTVLGEAALDAVGDALSGIPADDPESDSAFRRADQRISAQHIDGYYRAADAVASRISGERDLREAVAGACAADALDDACLRAFTERLLRRAFRHEPTAEEIDRALGAASDFDGFERLHAVLFVTLMAPDFLYRFENRGEAQDGAIALTDYEIATRLSYHFWGEPPDEELLRAAADGALRDEAGYEAQVDRLFEDPRTERTLIAFFEQWLHLDRGPFTASPRLDVLAEGMPTDGLAEEMREEVRDLIRYHLAHGGTWQDILTSQESFARTERLAQIYGTEVWDGESAPPRLPEGERSGLLTRAGVLYTADGSTNPFRRGAFLRHAILCDDVRPPPNDLPPDALTPPPVQENQTTREAFAAKVVDEPCASCHAQFSPIGYALESYDDLGRFRSEEWLVTTSGEDRGFAPIDPVVVPRVHEGDETPTTGAVELSERIAASPKANLCLTEQYFRFTFRREAEGHDECVIESLAHRVDEGLSLRDALRAVALEPGFRLRRLEN